MKKRFLQFFSFFAALVLSIGANAQTASDLFFSEYAEGSSNHKYIEIFNGTGNSVDLGTYVVLSITNGDSIWKGVTTFAPNTMIADNDVYVLATTSSDATILAEADATYAYGDSGNVVYYNGDDVRALAKIVSQGTTETDVVEYNGTSLYVQRIDQIGLYDTTDPGSGWDVAGVTNGTKDHTLIRKPTVTSPTIDFENARGTDAATSEWIVMPQNTWTNVGTHQFGLPTFPHLVINELMADNDTTLMDKDGDYDDWIEIYNPNANGVSLDGYYIADKDKSPYALPDTTVDAGGYIILWADNDGMGIHTDFALSKDNGDEVYLYNPNMEIIDSVKFGNQHVDTSYARLPNGTGKFMFATATPGMANMELPKHYPMYDIATVTTNDANGDPDSIGVECMLKGVVYSINYRAYKPGLDLVIHDGTGGIWIFNSSGTLGYDVRMGDEIEVKGTIGAYRGLTQIAPDEIMLVDSNKTLADPTIVTMLDESYEAELVTVRKVWVADTNDWPKPSDYDVSVDVTNGTDTFIMRISTETDIHDMPVRKDTMLVTGVVKQYNDDYQIWPRSMADLVTFDPSSINEKEYSFFNIFPNPNNGQFMIQNPNRLDLDITVINPLGKVVSQTRNADMTIEMNVDNKVSGLYLVRIIDRNNGSVSINKVIVK
jgi:DNA/RNA endonuclease YhcR with UshA esterase domain